MFDVEVLAQAKHVSKTGISDGIVEAIEQYDDRL